MKNEVYWRIHREEVQKLSNEELQTIMLDANSEVAIEFNRRVERLAQVELYPSKYKAVFVG